MCGMKDKFIDHMLFTYNKVYVHVWTKRDLDSTWN